MKRMREQLCQPARPHQPENMILAELPRDQYSYLLRYLDLVPLRSGDVLWEPNETVESVYFPNDGMALMAPFNDDHATDCADGDGLGCPPDRANIGAEHQYIMLRHSCR